MDAQPQPPLKRTEKTHPRKWRHTWGRTTLISVILALTTREQPKSICYPSRSTPLRPSEWSAAALVHELSLDPLALRLDSKVAEPASCLSPHQFLWRAISALGVARAKACRLIISKWVPVNLEPLE